MSSNDDMLRAAFNEMPGDDDARRGALKVSLVAAYAGAVAQVGSLIAAIIYVVFSAPIATLAATDGYAAFETETLKLMWEYRNAAEPVAQIWGFLGALSWLCIIPVFQTFGVLYKRNFLSTYMVQLVTAASVLNFFEFCLVVGKFGGANKVDQNWAIFTNDSAVQNGGFGAIQALELDYVVGQNSNSWVFGMSYLILASGFGIFFYVTYQDATPLPTKCNTAMVGILCVACVVAFVADLVGSIVVSASFVAGFFFILFEVVFAIWLVIAASALTKTMRSGGSTAASEIGTNPITRTTEVELGEAGGDDTV